MHFPFFFFYTLSTLLARGRAQVSVVASRGDWPKRTQGQAYSDQNHAALFPSKIEEEGEMHSVITGNCPKNVFVSLAICRIVLPIGVALALFRIGTN
jgi:hypothetical protein